MFADYRVTSPFGLRRHSGTGEETFHAGLDLVKAHRAPVGAFVPGRVVHAGPGVPGSGLGGYGNVVAIVDRYGSLHLYAHLDSVLVSEGQEVRTGEEVGRQGSTGQATGSHLHYEVRKTASPQFGWVADRASSVYDPAAYVAQYWAKEGSAMTFPDVRSGHWAENAIRRVSEAGLMNGYPDGTFRPDQPVTRAELAAVLAKLQRSS